MNPKTILLVKPSSLGDIVHTLPALRFIKQSFPSSKVYWVANTEWSPLLEDNPDLEGVIRFPRRSFRGLRGLLRFWQWCRELGKLRADLVLDFQGLFRSALISRSAGSRVVLGLADAREGARFFYQKVAPVTSSQHSVLRYLALASLAGADVSGEIEFRLPQGRPIPNFELPNHFVILHPFSRGTGKSLGEAEIYQLTAAMAPIPVIIVGKADSPISFARNAASLVNLTDLEQLIWLLRKAAFVISVDSGPMHLAAAVSREILSIHFWSDPRRVGPFRPDAWIWQENKILRKDELPEESPSADPSGRPRPEQIALFIRERLEEVISNQ
jgi:ADP-heptose:LPS heptosyltransferase